MMDRLLTPINYAKAKYVVVDPRTAVDSMVAGDTDGSWTDPKTMTFEDVDNAVLLSREHIGKTLTHYNMDLVESYNHQMVHGQGTWKSVIRAVQDALPDEFARRCAKLAGANLLSKAQLKFVRALKGYDWNGEKEQSPSTESSSSRVNLKPRPGEVRDR
jgi:hypothetical protein